MSREAAVTSLPALLAGWLVGRLAGWLGTDTPPGGAGGPVSIKVTALPSPTLGWVGLGLTRSTLTTLTGMLATPTGTRSTPTGTLATPTGALATPTGACKAGELPPVGGATWDRRGTRTA